MEEKISMSPKPKKQSPEKKNLDFFEALKNINQGKKVTKLEWESPEYYAVLVDGILKLHKTDDKLYAWIISDGDMSGEDYVIVE